MKTSRIAFFFLIFFVSFCYNRNEIVIKRQKRWYDSGVVGERGGKQGGRRGKHRGFGNSIVTTMNAFIHSSSEQLPSVSTGNFPGESGARIFEEKQEEKEEEEEEEEEEEKK